MVHKSMESRYGFKDLSNFIFFLQHSSYQKRFTDTDTYTQRNLFPYIFRNLFKLYSIVLGFFL